MAKKKPTTKSKTVNKEEIASVVLTICNDYGLTPNQRKGIEAILEGDPGQTQTDVAEIVKVRRETVNHWMHNRKFLDAMGDCANLIIDTAWPHILSAGVAKAKEGDVQWAKWLGEVSGRWHHKALLEHTGKVEQAHSGEVTIDGYQQEEVADLIRELRFIKSKRIRARTLN